MKKVLKNGLIVINNITKKGIKYDTSYAEKNEGLYELNAVRKQLIKRGYLIPKLKKSIEQWAKVKVKTAEESKKTGLKRELQILNRSVTDYHVNQYGLCSYLSWLSEELVVDFVNSYNEEEEEEEEEVVLREYSTLGHEEFHEEVAMLFHTGEPLEEGTGIVLEEDGSGSYYFSFDDVGGPLGALSVLLAGVKYETEEDQPCFFNEEEEIEWNGTKEYLELLHNEVMIGCWNDVDDALKLIKDHGIIDKQVEEAWAIVEDLY